MKADSSAVVKFTASASTLHSRPRPAISDCFVTTGSELTLTINTGVTEVFFSIDVASRCKCLVAVKNRPPIDQERLKKWREIDRRDVFKEFERKHGNKFSLLEPNKKKDKHRPSDVEELSEAELIKWKDKYLALKEKEEKKLKLFQKIRQMKKQDIEQLQDFDHRPYLQELLVVDIYQKIVDNVQNAKIKKQELEMNVLHKSRFDLEKKKLQRQILVYLKDILSSKRMVDYWKRQFTILIAFFSILTQISNQFHLLRIRRDTNRRRLAATLFAVSKVKQSVESRGSTTVGRTTSEIKM